MSKRKSISIAATLACWLLSGLLFSMDSKRNQKPPSRISSRWV
jgi:hypothetical protein